MKRSGAKFKVKSTQGKKSKHAHPAEPTPEVKGFAMAVMERVIDSPNAVGDLDQIIVDLGVNADKDPHSWDVANQATAYLLAGGALVPVERCEHGHIHLARAVAIFPMVPVIDGNRTAQGVMHVGCGLQGGYKTDCDENGVILAFFDKSASAVPKEPLTNVDDFLADVDQERRNDNMGAVLAREAATGELEPWFLYFVDQEKPAGQRFLGACIVEAKGMASAIREAWKLGINPGGTVIAYGTPKHKPSDRDRLITSDAEMAQLGYTRKVQS